MEIGDRIRAIRKRKKITQFELADLLHISQRAFSKIENGETELKVERLQNISRYLNVSVSDLLGVGTSVLENSNTQTSNQERSLYESRLLQQQKEIDFLKGLVNVFKS